MVRISKNQMILVAEGNIVSPKDEIVLLCKAKYMSSLALEIMMRLYTSSHVKVTPNTNYPGEYDFDRIKRAFAETSVRRSATRDRYFNFVFHLSANSPLYLYKDWQMIHANNNRLSSSKLNFNDLLRILDKIFDAVFIMVKDGQCYQLWGPKGTI